MALVVALVVGPGCGELKADRSSESTLRPGSGGTASVGSDPTVVSAPTPSTTTTAPPPPRCAQAESPEPGPTPTGVLFEQNFDRQDGLVTNEYAVWHSGCADRVWIMNSGSLFVNSHRAWSGVPDSVEPDALSSTSTDSAVFRLVTRRADFHNSWVTTLLDVNRMITTERTPSSDWDGVHLWVRYRSEVELYAVSVFRRDGRVAIKKKCAGGDTNGGTYHTLDDKAMTPLALGVPVSVGASAQDNPDGSVTVKLYRGGREVLSVVDHGVGCAPLTGPGAVGVRGDNADFTFDDFLVTPLP